MHYVFIYIHVYIYIYILYRYISMYYWNWPILYPNVYPSHDKHELVNSVRMNITEPPHLGWSWDTPDMPVCEVCENMLSTPQMAILIRKVIINLYIYTYIHTYICWQSHSKTPTTIAQRRNLVVRQTAHGPCGTRRPSALDPFRCDPPKG